MDILLIGFIIAAPALAFIADYFVTPLLMKDD